MPPAAVSPRAHASSSTSPPPSPSAASAGARDSALMRLVHELKPFRAAHGTKGAAWEAVARAMRSSIGGTWQGLACRNRVAYLLDRYDRQRAGKGPTPVLAALDADVAPILEETLLAVAQTRVEAQIKTKEKALVSATAALVKSRDDKKAERDRERDRDRDAKALAAMKEKDEKRAAAVVAAAARARDAVAVNTATVVAKRRKRKGVKTKEQKNATAGMFEVLRQSREEYMNQLRVQTAAEAAAEAAGGEDKALLTKKTHTKSSVDLDLHVLRAVSKCSPYSQETKQGAEAQWVAVTDRVMKYCNLKFTTTAVRDRCEALIKDFKANDCKRSTFGSGVAVADEERLGLLRVIRKAHDRQATRNAIERTVKSPEASQIDKDEDSAIEIEDEQADETNESREEDELEQWGSLEENRVEGEGDGEEEADEQVDESLVEDTQDEEEPEPNAQQHDDSEEPEHDFAGSVMVPVVSKSPLRRTLEMLKKRRRSESGASPDADPAVDMDMEQLQLDDNSLDWSESQDFTPRKYKAQRLMETEQDEKVDGTQDEDARLVEHIELGRPSQSHSLEPDSQVSAIITLVQAEREERRVEFKAMLDLVKQQSEDRRSEWALEHQRRSREQTDRQQEMTSLIGLLTRERKDRKSEMLTMLEAMNRDREDRREEFKAMMALMGKMVEAQAPSADGGGNAR